LSTVTISAGGVTVTAELHDTPTARSILESLPIEGSVNTWGDEIYFEIPVSLDLEPDARADVEVGDLGYWPTGRALCIFFGPTPASTDERPRAASAVNVLGHVVGDCAPLRTIPAGASITVSERVER
jgi:hypothetical protein